MRYSAVVEYDGGSYHGFQRQLDQPTIQGEIERALCIIAKKPVEIIGAGRTDTGVHARGQVISFDIEWRHDNHSLLRAVNANLPKDIAFLSQIQVHDRFHPRFDARERCYEYHICNREVRRPLMRNYSWHIRQELDVHTMMRATNVLVGRHDFATFGKPPVGQNTIREVFKAAWTKANDRFVFEIRANAFLNRMVRSLVGTLAAVGTGSWTVNDFIDAFEACDRARAGKTAPPQGLYLMSIRYGPGE